VSGITQANSELEKGSDNIYQKVRDDVCQSISPFAIILLLFDSNSNSAMKIYTNMSFIWNVLCTFCQVLWLCICSFVQGGIKYLFQSIWLSVIKLQSEKVFFFFSQTWSM